MPPFLFKGKINLMNESKTTMTQTIFTTQEPVIACDMDGVVVNFVAGVNALYASLGMEPYDPSRYEVDNKYRNKMWTTIFAYQDRTGNIFWRDLPMMEDALTLWNYIKRHHHFVLTASGVAKTRSESQKREWIQTRKEIFGDVHVEVVHRSYDKAKFAAPNRILVDDNMKSIGPWRNAGGIGILHTSAADTIEQLKRLGL